MSEPSSPEEAAEELGDQVVTASAEEWYEIVTNAFRKRDSAVRERCAQEKTAMRSKKLVQIGTIGVDAGMCYIGDPCYVGKTPLGMTGVDDDVYWETFLSNITKMVHGRDAYSVVTGKLPNGLDFPAAICVGTGYGDGEYPVYAEFEQGRIIKVVIEFD